MYAYLQMAQDEKAKGVLDEIMVLQKVPERGAEAYALAAIPSRAILEQGRWSDAASLSIHPSSYALGPLPACRGRARLRQGAECSPHR